MSRLDKIKDIADKRLKNIEMTESQKAAVHYRIAEKESGNAKSTFRYGRAAVWGGLALAAVLLAVLAVPSLKKGREVPSDMAESTAVFEKFDMAEKKSVKESEALPETKSGAFSVTPLSGSDSCIASDSAFMISTDTGITADQLENCLKIEPAVGYSLNSNGSGSYTVTPSESFDDGTVITLSLDYNEQHYAWAFQTEAKLSIISTTPGADSTNITTSAGIEIDFSSAVSSGAEKYITVSPAVDGKFEYHGRAVVFVPSEKLEKDKIYTVTVAKGLTSDSGNALDDDYVFSFRTDYEDGYWDNRFYFTNDAITSSFIPGDPIVFKISAGSKVQESGISVNIYKVPNFMEYLSLAEDYYEELNAQLGRSYDVEIPSKGLELYTSATCPIQRLSQYSPDLVVLPDLDYGWYLADFSAPSGRKVQKLIQVTPLSVYTQSMNGEVFVWVNNSSTGTAVSGADVQLTADGEYYSTASDGTAMFLCDTDIDYSGIIIHGDDCTFVDVLDIFGDKIETQKYRSTVYFDRSEYLPTDTVHFWGTVIPCNGAEMPKVMDIMLSCGGEPHSAGTVSVSADGVFSGELDLVCARSDYYYVQFTCGDETAAYGYFSVSKYTKPSYVLDIDFDRDYYRRGQSVNAEISGTFFDGTPAPGLSINTYGSGMDKNFNLDGDGKAKFSFDPVTYEEGWELRTAFMCASVTGAEDGSVQANRIIRLFPSDYMTTVDYDGSAISIRSNAINFDYYEKHTDDFYNDYDKLRGDPAVVNGTIKVYKNWYEAEKTGTTYDFINKITVPTYDYIYREELVYTEDFSTSGGVYTSTGFSPDGTEHAWYYAKIEYTTPDGAKLCETEYLSRGQYYPYSSSDYYYLHSDDYSAGIGEIFYCELMNNGELVTDGKLLCTVLQDRILGYDISNSGSYSVCYCEDYIPNIIICGAYFDGRHIYSVDSIFPSFDSSERALDIEITTDREVYAPGDTVKAKLHIESADGKDVSSDFVLGIVDEAALAIREQFVRPLDDIYRAYYFTVPKQEASYDTPADEPVAEGGSEGESESIRDDFPDTAAFIAGHTDIDGNAEVTFTLPDNLTSWRLTAVSATSDGYAGVKLDNISVSLDFFMNLVMNDTYAEGDDLALSARVYGVPGGSEIKYRVELDGKEYASVTGKSGEFTFFNLGKIDCGSYEVTVYADCGDYHDAIRRTVSVKQSRMELTRSAAGDLADGINIDASRYPVTLLLSCGDKNLSNYVMSRLLTSGGGRVDQVYAKKYAYDRLVSIDPDGAKYFRDPDPVSCQSYNGSVRLTSYSDGDVITTAYALIAMPEYIDCSAAKTYLRTVLTSDTSEIEVSASYMGLAALREPVLNDVRLLASQVTDNEAKYYTACALALLGDRENASKLYSELFRISTTDTYSFVDAGDSELNYELTARAAMVSTLMGSSDRYGLVTYLLLEDSSEYLANFQLMTYLRHEKAGISKASFTCNYGGEKLSCELEGLEMKVLEFNRDELENADFKITSGSVAYAAVYTGSTKDLKSNGDKYISIQSDFSKSAKAGDNVNIDFTVSFDDSCPGDFYTIDIALPSGLRYVACENGWDKNFYFAGEEDGTVRLLLRRTTYRGEKIPSIDFRIYARAALPGEYTFEAPVVQGCESGLTCIGKTSAVNIGR